MIQIDQTLWQRALRLDHIPNWLNKVVEEENKSLGDLTIVLGDDEWLLGYNMQYLQHDYYTDIITFDYTEQHIISGDLLISVERVYANAEELNVPRETELNRVIVHGLLHLCGYGDNTEKKSQKIRKKEDYYLNLL
jgi:rRNA maturation RNase YbeY